MTGSPEDVDALLMARIQKGDRRAFEELVDKYKQPVMNFAYRFVPDAAEAEDLAQMVFIQVFKSAQRYRVTARFTTWLFTIARNLCFNEIRRRSRHPTEPLEIQSPEESGKPGKQMEDTRVDSPPDTVLRAELVEKVQEALRELPENQRTAILLFQEQQLPYEEIGKILGCSLSATKSLIHRGRETLKKKIKPYLQTGQWKRPGEMAETFFPER